MKKSIDERLVDEAIEAYVDWREERVSVWDAYERWACGPLEDASFAFSAYRAALDREERASDVYAGLMTRVATAPSAMQPSPQEPTTYLPLRRVGFAHGRAHRARERPTA